MIDIDHLPMISTEAFYAGRLRPIRLAVLHTTESPEDEDGAENVARYLASTGKASVHLVADANSVVRQVADKDTAWGAENANADGLHVEQVGYAAQDATDWADEFSQALLRNTAACVRQWCDKYDLPKRRLTIAEIADGVTKGICGHADVYQALGGQAVRTDPGPEYPWAQFISLVNGTTTAETIKEPDVNQFPHATLNGHTIVAVRGNDGGCYWAHRVPNGGWDAPANSKFMPTGDPITSWPDVVSDGQRIMILMRGNDGNMYERVWTEATGLQATAFVGGPVPDVTKLG